MPYAGPGPYDAKDPDARFDPIAPIRPPEGAPNVLIVLIDDVGFGASSAFGGPFIGGETDQWYPTLHEGTNRAEPWGTPEEGYHFTEDLTDKAIASVASRRHWRETSRCGEVTLFVDGVEAGSGRVEHTEPIGFGYEYTDVGRDDLWPVTNEYKVRDNAFTGMIEWVELEAGQDSHDHLIDPEDVLAVAMAKQ